MSSLEFPFVTSQTSALSVSIFRRIKDASSVLLPPDSRLAFPLTAQLICTHDARRHAAVCTLPPIVTSSLELQDREAKQKYYGYRLLTIQINVLTSDSQ